MKRLLALACAAAILAQPGAARSQELQTDLPLPGGGRWYAQASGDSSGRLGYPVIDNADAPMFREFIALGGVRAMGYPISRRFIFAGFETQVFQRFALQWKPSPLGDQADILNIFDLMSEMGYDGDLEIAKQVPPKAAFKEEGKQFSQIVRDRLALLDDYPTLRRAFNDAPGDPVAYFGLPTAPVQGLSNQNVLRTQRAVFQHWTESVPWAAAGTVTVAAGGDTAKELGLFPDSVWRAMTLVEATAPGAGASNGLEVEALPSGAPRPPEAAPGPPGPAPAPPDGGGPPAAPQPSRPAAPPGTYNTSQPFRLQSVANPPNPLPGQRSVITIRVVDVDGKPVVGALCIILVGYPLKTDETAHAVDGIFVARVPTDESGRVSVEILIDPRIPRGLGINLAITAIYPPTSGNLNHPMVVG